jgi:hypothetical protein
MGFAERRIIDVLKECRCKVASWRQLDDLVGGYPKLYVHQTPPPAHNSNICETGQPVRFH